MAHESNDQIRPVRTRSRSGCLNCRTRRRKCDGVRPSCLHCRSRGEECRYGVKALFHPSRELTLSQEDSVALNVLEEERGSGLFSTCFVDNTAQIVLDYQRLGVTSKEYSQASEATEKYKGKVTGSNTSESQSIVTADEAASDETNAESGTLEDSTTSVWVEDSTSSKYSTRTSLLDVHHGTVSSADASCPIRSEDSGSASNTPPAFLDIALPVSECEKLQLIRSYLQETGTWCEITDSGRHFTTSYAHKLMDNKPFVAVAMALASRQLDAINHCPRLSTLSLYQYAVQSLLHYEPSQCGEATLACCVLLSLYEMMTSGACDTRRHLKGCVFNLNNKCWNGSSPALVGASFWAFARMDSWAAFLSGGSTLLPPERWVDDGNIASLAATGAIDDFCNLTTVLFGKIVNVLAGHNERPEITQRSNKIGALWRDLQSWRTHRPREVLPLLRTGPSRGSPFPTVLYTTSSSICGNAFYHTACMLLLRTGQVPDGDKEFNINHQYHAWHAKELCGLSMTNKSHGSWVNQVNSLYIAGQIFGAVDNSTSDTEAGEDYASEKIALLKHLAQIERETGWPTATQATKLRKLWGLE